MSFESLHPLLVHFPIALLVVVALFDLVALAFPRAELARTSLYLSAAAAIGAVAAYFSGEAAEEPVEHLAGIAHVLERHEDLGKLLVMAALGALVLRAVVYARRWHEPVAGRSLVAVLGLALAVLVGLTGHAGGQLVYDYGAGVAPVMQESPMSSGR